MVPVQDRIHLLDARYWKLADYVSAARLLCALSLVIWFALASATILGSLALSLVYMMAWVVVGCSDAIDGRLARHYGGSPRGATIDELSDKLAVWAALTTLATFGRVAIWFVVIMVARDVAMTAMRMWMRRRRGSEAVTSARWPGKVKTVLQFTLIVAAFSPWFGSPEQILNLTLAAASTVASLVAFLQAFYVALAVSNPAKQWSAFKDQFGNIAQVNDGSDGPVQLGAPNCLTTARMSVMLAIPAYLLIFQPLGLEISAIVALVVAVLAMLTDLFDGILARRNAQSTEFGTALDPIADKISIYLFTIGLLVSTRWTLGVDPTWLLGCGVVILLRDLLTLPAVLILKNHTTSMPRPLFVDKLRAALLMVLAATVCLGIIVPQLSAASLALLVLAAFVSLVSIIANVCRIVNLRAH